MLMNDSQTADELPTKIISFVGGGARLETEAAINEVTSLNRAELCESVITLESQIILTMLMNDSQPADELPT